MDGVADVAGEFRKARADLVDANTHIADIVAGVPMRKTYPVVEDSEDAILAGYHDMDKFAHRSAALDLFADMHTGLCRDGSASIGGCANCPYRCGSASAGSGFAVGKPAVRAELEAEIRAAPEDPDIGRCH